MYLDPRRCAFLLFFGSKTKATALPWPPFTVEVPFYSLQGGNASHFRGVEGARSGARKAAEKSVRSTPLWVETPCGADGCTEIQGSFGCAGHWLRQCLASLRMTTWSGRREFEARRSGAPDALLGVERGEHYGLVVDLGGVLVDGGSGLGAEVAIAGIEVESADVVGAAGAGKLHAAFDPSDGVVSLHNSSVIP